jgi:membrane-associated phospholipid phosphatase
MSLTDSLIALFITIFVLIGGYQIYLLPQKYRFFKTVNLHTRLDAAIPFRPNWVWTYSCLYYPLLCSVILTLDSLRQFSHVIMSFIALLLLQVVLAFLIPVKTPDLWRSYDPKNSRSAQFLSRLQAYDQGGNCFPSMHVSAVSLSLFHILANSRDWFTPWTALMIVIAILISASTVLIKQHYVLDIPGGIALAGFVFWVFQLAS